MADTTGKNCWTQSKKNQGCSPRCRPLVGDAGAPTLCVTMPINPYYLIMLTVARRPPYKVTYAHPRCGSPSCCNPHCQCTCWTLAACGIHQGGHPFWPRQGYDAVEKLLEVSNQVWLLLFPSSISKVSSHCYEFLFFYT